MISIVEAAEQKMKKCSDDDTNGVDTVILLQDNVDSLTDDEEAQDNHVNAELKLIKLQQILQHPSI